LAETRQIAQTLRARGLVIVVRHGATFADQTDTDPLNPDNVAAEREASLFRPENGSYTLVARIQMDEWPQVAGARK
jgi:hypothetical protein